MGIVVPRSYLDEPRWWHGGREWLDRLPALVDEQCDRWQLHLDGDPAHGAHALVVPVRRDDERFALRITPPDQDLDALVRALTFWDGHGVVRLVDVDVPRGALLLERLGVSLRETPADQAVAVLGWMMTRLAVPAPLDVPSTADLVRDRAAHLEAEWAATGEPFAPSLLAEALRTAARLSSTDSTSAVNGDLHSAQLLRGSRAPWLVVDPILMRGDIAYDLGRVLWTRLDEMDDIERHFDIAVRSAKLDRDHARDWVVFRTVDYWLWGLSVGLTEDPERCRRLLAAIH